MTTDLAPADLPNANSCTPSISPVPAADQSLFGHSPESVVALYERALIRDPKNHFLLVDLARAYASTDRREKAEQALDRVLKLYPRSAHVRLLVAGTYVLLSQPTQAIDHYRAALELEPQHPDSAKICLEIANLHENAGHCLDALEALLRAHAFAPDRADIALRLAALKARNGRQAFGERRT